MNFFIILIPTIMITSPMLTWIMNRLKFTNAQQIIMSGIWGALVAIWIIFGLGVS